MRQTTKSITDENWPRHPDGRRKHMGELTRAQQEAIVRRAVERLKPEFQKIGVALSFKGQWKNS